LQIAQKQSAIFQFCLEHWQYSR